MLHSVPKFAFRARPLTLQVILQDGVHAIEQLTLSYTYQNEVQMLRMLPTDGYRTAQESFSVYSATVPAAHPEGARFTYTLTVGNERGVRHSVPLADLPTLPPFVFTETATEMREAANFYELCTPGEQDIDL